MKPAPKARASKSKATVSEVVTLEDAQIQISLWTLKIKKLANSASPVLSSYTAQLKQKLEKLETLQEQLIEHNIGDAFDATASRAVIKEVMGLHNTCSALLAVVETATETED